MNKHHPLMAALAVFPLLTPSLFGQESEAPAPDAEAGGASIEIAVMEAAPQPNSAEVDAMLAEMRKAHQGLLQYQYSAKVGIQVMMGGPGSSGEPMEAQFTRTGSVLQGGPLGTLIEIKKSLELPGMGAMVGGMDEEMRVLMRRSDYLFDIKPSEMAAMTGAPQGLAKLSKKDAEELDAMLPMPAPMNFVMMQTPRFVDPLSVVEVVAEQTALTKLTKREDGKIVIQGATPSGLNVGAMPGEEPAAGSMVTLTLDGETKRLLSLTLGTPEKNAMSLTLSKYAVPAELDPARFDLNPDGKDVADYAALLRQQLEQMMQMDVGGPAFEDEDEF